MKNVNDFNVFYEETRLLDHNVMGHFSFLLIRNNFLFNKYLGYKDKRGIWFSSSDMKYLTDSTIPFSFKVKE